MTGEEPRRAWLPGIAAAATTFAFAFATLGDVGIVWDEPFFWQKQERIDRWYKQIFGSDAERKQALSAAGLKDAWPFCVATPHENPPVYAICSHATWAATRGWLDPVRGRRFAPAILFSIAAGVLVHLSWNRWGPLPALTTLGTWVMNPRVFTHGRLSTIDMTMTVFWLLAAVAFLAACERRRGAWRFGPLLALGVMSKFTAILALPALAMWSLVYRRWYVVPIFAFTIVLLPLCMIAVHPGWWADPIEGMRTAIDVHRHRHETQMVPTYYLGKVYDHALPWHNTLVLTAACVPLPWVVLAIVGLIGVAFRGWRDAFVGWFMANWLVMMIVRATPFAPGHDGIRQFLAAFPYFALLAGYGTATLLGDCQNRRRLLIGGLVAAAWISASIGWIRTRPLELSYYSDAIGGLPGAERLGLETTYWWDASTPEMLAELNRLPPNVTIGLSGHYLDVFEEYQKVGRLRPDLKFIPFQKLVLMGPGSRPEMRRTNYYLILRREGMLLRTDKPPLTPILKRFEQAFREPALAEVKLQGVRLLVLVNELPNDGDRQR